MKLDDVRKKREDEVDFSKVMQGRRNNRRQDNERLGQVV